MKEEIPPPLLLSYCSLLFPPPGSIVPTRTNAFCDYRTATFVLQLIPRRDGTQLHAAATQYPRRRRCHERNIIDN